MKAVGMIGARMKVLSANILMLKTRAEVGKREVYPCF